LLLLGERQIEEFESGAENSQLPGFAAQNQLVQSIQQECLPGCSGLKKTAAKTAGSPDPPHSAGWFQAEQLRG
jgi:hypothetical protein